MSELREKLFSDQDEVELSIDEEISDDGHQNLDLEAAKAFDRPRVLQAGLHEKKAEVRKRTLYGTESSRVLNLAPNQWRFRFIKLLSLLNAFCYPFLALLSIRL